MRTMQAVEDKMFNPSWGMLGTSINRKMGIKKLGNSIVLFKRTYDSPFHALPDTIILQVYMDGTIVYWPNRLQMVFGRGLWRWQMRFENLLEEYSFPVSRHAPGYFDLNTKSLYQRKIINPYWIQPKLIGDSPLLSRRV